MPFNRVAISIRRLRPMSGTETIIMQHTQKMSALGWEVHIFSTEMDQSRIRGLGGFPHEISRKRWPWNDKRQLFSKRVSEYLNNHSFDLTMGHGDTLQQDVLSLHNCVHATFESTHGKPIEKQTSVSNFHSQLLRSQKFHRLIANSQLMKNDLIRRFKIDSQKIDVVYPGYDPNKFHSGIVDQAEAKEIRQKLGDTGNSLIVGLITSGDFVKRGVTTFLESLAELPRESQKKIIAFVMGREKNIGTYLTKAADLGLDDRVHFLDPEINIAPYYRAMDVMLYPAHFEEFGLTVQEAVMSGVPVLTSTNVGASELFEGVAKANVLENPSKQQYSHQLDKLIHLPDLRKEWSEDAKKGTAHNTWDHNFRQTLASINNIHPS